MITVKYQTIEEYCQCCDQKLKEPKVSSVREFDFSDEDLESSELVYLIENNELDEAKSHLAELLFETIAFYAVSNTDAQINFHDGEIDKVMKYVLDKF